MLTSLTPVQYSSFVVPGDTIINGDSLNANGKSTALLEVKYNPYQFTLTSVFQLYLRHTTASPLEYFM
nr:MAG TPA: DIM protein [Caudoviricetes sp.]